MITYLLGLFDRTDKRSKNDIDEVQNISITKLKQAIDLGEISDHLSIFYNYVISGDRIPSYDLRVGTTGRSFLKDGDHGYTPSVDDIMSSSLNEFYGSDTLRFRIDVVICIILQRNHYNLLSDDPGLFKSAPDAETLALALERYPVILKYIPERWLYILDDVDQVYWKLKM